MLCVKRTNVSQNTNLLIFRCFILIKGPCWFPTGAGTTKHRKKLTVLVGKQGIPVIMSPLFLRPVTCLLGATWNIWGNKPLMFSA